MDSTERWLYSHPRHKPQGPHQKAVFDVWGPRMGGMSCYCTVAEKPVLRSCFLKTCSGERLLLHCSFFHPITQELKTAEGTRYWNMKMQNLLPKILSYNAVRFQQWHFIHHLFLFLFWFFFSNGNINKYLITKIVSIIEVLGFFIALVQSWMLITLVCTDHWVCCALG